MTLPINRTVLNTAAEHVADHNTAHDILNDLNGTYVALVPGVATDGTTDSSVAIQAAIDTASTAGIAAGGPARVVLPSGVAIRCNLVLKPRVILDLNGSVLKPAVGSNADVIKGLNFATLTDKVYAVNDTALGCYQAGVINGTVDGDKANQTAGWCIRLWGRSLTLADLIVQNGNDGGIWTEFTTHDAGATVDLLEGWFDNIKSSNHGGDGWRFRGPHDSIISNYVAVSNTGYALKSEFATNSYRGGLSGRNWNSWLNTAGSYYFGDTARVDTIDATADAAGIGIEFAVGLGNCKLTNFTIAGHTVGLLLRGDAHQLSGSFGDCSSDAIQIGSAGAGTSGRHLIDVIGYGTIGGYAVNNINVAAPSYIRGRFSTVTTGLVNGFGSTADTYDLWALSGGFFRVPGQSYTSAYTGYSPKHPASNGTIVCCDLQGATTVGAAGAAAAPPAAPLGWMRVQLPDGTSVKVPYYNL